MKKIDLFLFDLDGTLIDSKKDIADSVNHTMSRLGLPPLSDELIYSFVGNGVTPLIQKSVETKSNLKQAVHFKEALQIFKAHYDEHLLDQTRVYPGIEEVLLHFKKTPKVIVTNKSQGFSEKIIRGLKIDHFFEGIFGGDTQFPKKPEPQIILHLLKTFRANPQNAVIVGDSRIDMETGRNSGILTCGVTYGFRPRKELKETCPDELIEKPEDLIKIFQPS